jgi:hypothetical protein
VADSTAAHEIPLPPGARERSTLTRVDYENAVLVEIGPADGSTAEQWARAILEGAPAPMRAALTGGWARLGLPLGPEHSEQHVLGWAVRPADPGAVLLRAGSPGGLRAELLIERRPDAVLVASFVQHDGDAARTAWTEVEGLHAPVVCQLLDEAVARAG